MRLRIMTPGQVVLDTEVSDILGHGSQGSFGLWAEDTDCVSDLVAGVLRYRVPGAEVRYAGLTGGILVKQGPLVTINTRRAYLGTVLADVRRRISAQLRETEQLERAALQRLDAEMEVQFRVLGHPVFYGSAPAPISTPIYAYLRADTKCTRRAPVS